jgi:hypothetical protein
VEPKKERKKEEEQHELLFFPAYREIGDSIKFKCAELKSQLDFISSTVFKDRGYK